MKNKQYVKCRESKEYFVAVVVVKNSPLKFHHWAGHTPGFTAANTSVLCPFVIQFLLLEEG